MMFDSFYIVFYNIKSSINLSNKDKIDPYK